MHIFSGNNEAAIRAHIEAWQRIDAERTRQTFENIDKMKRGELKIEFDSTAFRIPFHVKA